MKDNNEQNSFLVGCASHTPDGPPQSDSLDPESFSYFLVRRNLSSQDNSTESTSRQNSNSPDKEHYPSHRRHHSRGYSSAKSPKSPNTRKSGDSRNGKKKEGGSIDSSQSASSRYKNMTDWNAAAISTSPSSFGQPQRNLVDPPRAPKSGHEWVWFPEGYWAEREIRGFMPTPSLTKRIWWSRSSGQKSQKSQSTRKSTNGAKDQNDDQTPPSFNLPQIKIGSVSLKSTTKTSRRTSRHTSENNVQRSGNIWGFNFNKSGQEEDQSTQQREGLYDRAKRTIEARFRKRSADKLSLRSLERPSYLASRTTTLLQGASNYFDRTQLRTHTAGRSPRPSMGSRDRPRLGVAPWHRRHSQDSMLSVSSSVRKLLMGKTPIATPRNEKHYVGPEGKNYPAVQLASSDPDEPTFLPSEARRIKTPPLNPGTPDISATEVLSDVSAPDEITFPLHSLHTSPELGGSPKLSAPLSRQRWECDTDKGNKSTDSSARSPPPALTSPKSFELNLPEHLPSSPLCPKSPKHKSGGTGICAFHGRKKSVRLKHIKRASTGESNVPPAEA